MGGRKGMLFGKQYRAPHKRRQQAYPGRSSLCGARLATFSDKPRRRARISGKEEQVGSPPLPPAPPSPRRYLCRRSDSGFCSRAAPAPAALRAALPGETTCCRLGCFSAFRWLFHLPPCSTPTAVTAAPAARAEIPLPSFYRGDAAVPRRGWERGPAAERRAMSRKLPAPGQR